MHVTPNFVHIYEYTLHPLVKNVMTAFELTLKGQLQPLGLGFLLIES